MSLASSYAISFPSPSLRFFPNDGHRYVHPALQPSKQEEAKLKTEHTFRQTFPALSSQAMYSQGFLKRVLDQHNLTDSNPREQRTSSAQLVSSQESDGYRWYDESAEYLKRAQGKTKTNSHAFNYMDYFKFLAESISIALSAASVKALIDLFQDPSIQELCEQIARLSLEHPDETSKEFLYKVHDELKEKLVILPDEVLEFLIGGSILHARGGFYNAAHLRQFLCSDPQTISSERLICGFETLGTAIGYRMIAADWTRPPFTPKTEAQQEFLKILKSTAHLVPPIYMRYFDRGRNIIHESEKPLEEVPEDCCAGVQRQKTPADMRVDAEVQGELERLGNTRKI